MPAYPRAHVIRNAILTLEAVDYANQVNKARLVPDTPIQTMRTLVPDGQIQDVDSTVWTLELSGIQDYGAGGLAAALAAAAGTQLTLVLQPKAGSAQDKVTCEVMCLPVEFGGEQGTFRTFEAELPIVGDPVFAQSV
jgi:hypothetical protein